MTALGAVVPFVHLVPFATDHGASTQRAVWLLATIGIGSTLGRLVLGGLADRLERMSSLVGMIAGMGLLGSAAAALAGALLLVPTARASFRGRAAAAGR